MEQDRIDGVGHQIKGVVKSGIGKIIGDAKLRTEGAAEQASGKMQSDLGTANDARTGIDRDRIAGIGHQLRGAVKEGFGRIIGDAAIQADGAAERAAGKAQNARGSAREIARDDAASTGAGEADGDAEVDADGLDHVAPKHP